MTCVYCEKGQHEHKAAPYICKQRAQIVFAYVCDNGRTTFRAQEISRASNSPVVA